MTLVIGDIHGCLVSLQAMLELVQPDADDHIITLGDYVDRGSQSRGVINALLLLKQTHRLTHLMGNHEIQMIRARQQGRHRQRFLDPMCGGQETLKDYGGSFENIPENHWNFLRSAELFHETEDFIFVHAGLDENLPMNQQNPEILYYKRFHLAQPHYSGKPFICGHSIQGNRPVNKKYAICLDTGAYDDGWLTALDPHSNWVWQTNERGRSRQFRL